MTKRISNTLSLRLRIPKEISKYEAKLTPAIILIPGVTGNTGEGMAAGFKQREDRDAENKTGQAES